MTMTDMTPEEAINRMFTCATAERCAREEACFRIVTEMKRRMEAERLQQALDQRDVADSVIGYAPRWPTLPHWENSHADCLDWDAA